MKDLSRLLDEQGTDPLEADLLRLARSEGPSGESRRRILAGLGVAVAAGTVSSSSAASGSATGAVAAASRPLLKWGIFGAVVVGAAAVALLVLGRHPGTTPLAPATPSPTLTVAAAPTVAPAAAPTVTADPAQVTKLEDLPTLPDSPSGDAAHAAAPSLADEVLAIKGAKSALASGNAAESLRQLDAYRAHFPHGRLSQEATVVRIEALLKSGNQASANALADRFLAAHADSPYASRVHTLVGH